MYKSWKYFLGRFARLALKMKLFLQELKNLALILQELARKNCKIIFLQDMIKILQENYLAIFSCKVLQDQCKIFQFLQEKLHFSASLARFNARSCKSARKILARLAHFLQDGFYWVSLCLTL